MAAVVGCWTVGDSAATRAASTLGPNPNAVSNAPAATVVDQIDLAELAGDQLTRSSTLPDIDTLLVEKADSAWAADLAPQGL
jgi:hypothetical protein